MEGRVWPVERVVRRGGLRFVARLRRRDSLRGVRHRDPAIFGRGANDTDLGEFLEVRCYRLVLVAGYFSSEYFLL